MRILSVPNVSLVELALIDVVAVFFFFLFFFFVCVCVLSSPEPKAHKVRL